ncbi:sex-determining region Y protein [Elysia marginata]|uniref:Sex-determining region Y protein n=1 Tax=Elysia marginata TaxID=1093978 RepID=A0AAV4FYY9_9GAST|nr:sex-determining region Y protein [Elysia marginata]
MHIDELKGVDLKLDLLIEFVCRIKLEHAWDHIQPHELNNAYTSLTNCKKGSMRKNFQGHLIQKRSMNPFLIWSSQCRRLVSEIFPQVKIIDHSLFNKKLGVWWKTLSVEEKDVFRIANEALDKHHAAEFPDYKYRPEKKVTKEANKKLETCTKTKRKMRRKSHSTTSQPQQQQQNHQAYKGLQAYNQFVSGWVQEVVSYQHQDVDNILVKAKVGK